MKEGGMETKYTNITLRLSTKAQFFGIYITYYHNCFKKFVIA